MPQTKSTATSPLEKDIRELLKLDEVPKAKYYRDMLLQMAEQAEGRVVITSYPACNTGE